MKPEMKIAFAAILVTLTGCVAMEDRPQEVITSSGVQRDTYIPREGTAPYHGLDPYGTKRPNPVTME